MNKEKRSTKHEGLPPMITTSFSICPFTKPLIKEYINSLNSELSKEQKKDLKDVTPRYKKVIKQLRDK